jgi:hypothetical protein
MDEDYLLFVVEYKVKGELFVRKFAYESKCIDAMDGLLYINTLDGAELTINRNFLEYRIERPLKVDETFE